ncbi:SCO family protein [Paenibacillus sp. GCM10027626]|uniref:SCO family protein n=1 Tax=Paenibacillus sp. GCM10027626 TaxID=3273411 RepID=UPI00363370D8
MAFLRKHAFKIAVLALCAAMGIYLYWSNLEKTTVDLSMKQAVADFELTDLDNNPVKFSDSNGKVRVIYFYFANCPDICPPTTFLMSQLQEELKKDGSFGKDVEFISITFDPERDTPEAIRKFIEKIPGDIDQSGWKFLRGTDYKQTEQLMKDNFNLGLRNNEDGTFLHSDIITFVDREGNIRKQMTGSIQETAVKSLKDTVKAMLKE